MVTPGQVVSAPIRFVGRAITRRLCRWKLAELRRYQAALRTIARDAGEPMRGNRAEAIGAMLRRLGEEIALLERTLREARS